MLDQWSLVAKRSNGECAGLSAKRQRKAQGLPEEAAEWEDAPQIRGGLSRPRPPPLGPPPNRATNSGSQANTANLAGSIPGRPISLTSRVWAESDSDDEEEGRIRTGQQNPAAPAPPAGVNTAGVQVPPVLPKPPPQVGNTTTPKPPGQGPPHLPTPPQSGSSNIKQGGGAGAVTGPGGSTVTTTTGTGSTAAGAAQYYSTEEEILRLFDQLNGIVTLWVRECLPDTFPPEFERNRPETYWELCGWTRPLSLGNTMLHDRSWAKFVYESWVWRLLHQEIFQVDSLAWAGGDVDNAAWGGLGGRGRAINQLFDFVKQEQPNISVDTYRERIQQRAEIMKRVREQNAVTQEQKYRTTGWLVEEMLVAFHPYFPDEYQPIEHAENIEVLIRDTHFLISKAQELDDKLRSARHVYEMTLGKEGDVVRITGVPPPKMQNYQGSRFLQDDDYIALIVVPGLVKNDFVESAGVSPGLVKSPLRFAKAFTQRELNAAVASTAN